MTSNAHSRIADRDRDYEQSTRLIRWMIMVMVLATFPPGAAQASLVYGLVALAGIYNITRYIPALLRVPVFASNITMLVVDNALVCTLLIAIGNVATPYSAFLVFMLISAAYRYGLKGLVSVLSAQAVFIVLAQSQTQFPPLQLDQARNIILVLSVLFSIGLFVVWLTRMDRSERRALKTLGHETEVERERLLTLINSLDDAIIVADQKGRVVLANGASQEMIGGVSVDDLRGEDLTGVLPLRPRTKPDEKPVRIIEAGSGAQRRRDLSIFRADGTAIDLDISVTPVHLGAKGGADFIIVCRDITKERSLERQREEFISVASHELRTPLTIAEAAISTAMLDKLPPQSMTLLDQAHRNILFLSELTKDLTTLAQAQNDSIPVALKPVDAKALLLQLGSDFEREAKEKQLPIQVKIAPDTPQILTTEHHIREILQNFLSNSLKYTQKGSITLAAEPTHGGGVLFSVSDTGVGISTKDQRHLFTKFYRSEDYRTRETGGTGLGLYLCMELSHRLNGKIWLKSVLNEGSTFFLEVPPFSRLDRDHGKVVEAQVSSLVDQL